VCLSGHFHSGTILPMLNDVRFAFRTLRRAPVFTAVVVLSLALGIGANTAIFSLLDQVLLRSLPVRDPARLVVLHTPGPFPGMSTADNRESVFSYPLYKDLRDRANGFEGVIARAGAPVSVSDGGTSERAGAELVSGNFFQVLGVQAVVGRTIRPEEDDVPGAHPVAMLSSAYWVRRFGGRRDIVNSKILINGNPMTVVGILPASFHSVIVGSAPDVFVPITMKRQITPTFDGLDDFRFSWLSVFARLKPGLSVAQAQAATAAVFRPLLADLLSRYGRMRSPRAEQLFLSMKLDLLSAAQGVNELRREFRSVLLALMAMVALVLLISAANVAGLLTARATARSKEIAVRLAIGAGRWPLVRQLLVESAILALLGGLLGLLVARWTIQGLLRTMGGDEGMGDVLSAAIDARVLSFNLALSVATGLAFGLVPALQSTRARVAAALKDQSVSAGTGIGQARFRRVLVVAQVGLSLVLLVGSGLFARSVSRLLNVDPGFKTDDVFTFAVDPTLKGYPTPRVYEMYGELQRRLERVPGVKAVSAANPGPLTHSNRGSSLTVEGYQASENEDTGASTHAVGASYFRALSVKVIEGREFDERDVGGTLKAAVVNAAFVKKYGAGRPVLGRHLTFAVGNRAVPDREIVGVVADFKHSDLREDVTPSVYIPYTQDDRPSPMTFYMQSAGAGPDLGAAIRRVVHGLDADLPVYNLKPMQAYVSQSTSTDRLLALLATAFGLLATLLAAIGLYGVIAFNVARRTQEIGVRMALGARPGTVVGLVLREVAVMAAAGLAIGLPCALAATRLVQSQLFGISSRDPIVFACAALGLTGVALVAGLIPARRAAAIDPLQALRHE
jgi:predicted permease